MEQGRGYWINTTQVISLYLKGGTTPIARTQALAASSIAQSLPTPPATYYGLAPAVGLTVRAMVNGAICGQAQTALQELGGQRRPAFAISVRAVGAGADAGCGAPGQLVTLSFMSGAREVWRMGVIWDNNVVHEIRNIYLPLLNG